MMDLKKVGENLYEMSTELLLTGELVLTVKYCMVCGKHADEAMAVMDPYLHFKWKPCGHKLELT